MAESEIVQIIGRARGCNRTEANPVDVWVLGNMPLPLPVNRLISASDLTPSPGDLMAAEGGVELANPTDASEAYPTYGRPETPRKRPWSGIGRRAWGQTRIREYLYENVPKFRLTTAPAWFAWTIN